MVACVWLIGGAGGSDFSCTGVNVLEGGWKEARFVLNVVFFGTKSCPNAQVEQNRIPAIATKVRLMSFLCVESICGVGAAVERPAGMNYRFSTF